MKFKNEKEIYEFWQKKKFFSFDQNSLKKTYSLLMPPPNLTGELHLGHALQHSIMDAVARFKRLQGFEVLLLPGVDHAGIQFEGTLDKKLSKDGKTKRSLGREKWLEEAWKFKDEIYKSFHDTWTVFGISADWSREVFTLNDGPKQAVFEEFKTFWDKDLIYKGPYIVQWCPKCNTAIEDVEMEYEERKEKLYFLKYGPFTLATARPETKFGDTAMAVNPNDKRYKEYVGKEFEIETLVGKKKMKVVADNAVDPKFGTGVIKVTPGHDFTDYEIGKRHNLPIVQVINKEGRLTDLAGKYSGMKVLEARQAMIPDLKAKGILVKEEEYTHNVSVCERCKSVVEPLISEEWFVKMDELAKGAIKIINEDKIKFLPINYKKILTEWLGDIHDWCISRSLWWGHRIPVWYCGGKKNTKKIGFNAQVVPQLYTGKTKTYRLKDKGLTVGDRVAFENTQTGVFLGFGLISKVEITTVGKLSLDDAAHGAVYKKRSDLITAFKRYYSSGFVINNDTKVFVYSYEFVNKDTSKESCGILSLSLDKPSACPHCECKDIEQDEQVLDTWFSSGLWPMSTLGWTKESQSGESKWEEMSKAFPWSFEISAPEIKYMWIARMIMLSVYFTGEVPFKTMFFHGMLRDMEGRKFSKSLGNGIEPAYLVDKWGVDASRMALYTYSIPGRDGRVNKAILDERGKNFRNFGTKLRNISHFILDLKPNTSVRHSGLSRIDSGVDQQSRSPQNDKAGVSDQWIIDELNITAKKVTKNLDNLELHLAVDELYEFVWHKLADKYIESTKERRRDAQPTLENVLKQILILLHPFMPFITEEIYQMFDVKKKSIVLEQWPSI